MNARTLTPLALLLMSLILSLPAIADDAAPTAAPDVDPAAEALLEEEAEPNPLYDLFYQVDDLLTSEKKEEATTLLMNAMTDATYAKYKGDLATVVVRFLLFTEQIEKAQEFFLTTIRTEPEIARPGFELIYGFFLNGEDASKATDWAKTLLEQPLENDMRQTATSWLLTGLLSANKEDELFAELGRLEKLSPETASAVADELCRHTYQNDKFDLLLKEIDTFSKAPYGSEEALRQTLTSYTLLAKAGKADWEGVQADFPNTLTSLKERNLQTMLVYLFGRARQQKATLAAESIANTVLHAEVCKDYAAVRNIAAREWVSAGMAQDKASLPERIAAIRALGIPSASILSNISRHFYDVLEEKPVIEKLITELDAIRQTLDDEARRNTANSLLLDASFIVEDYERALAIINAGVPDHDEAWHTMTRTKILAHVAQKKGDIDEAVKQYRAFMASIAESNEVTPDPTSGIIYTPEMIQGLNAKRIADLYRGAGRTAEADAALAEAKAFYEKALVRAKGSETEKGLGDETVQAIESILKGF